MKLDGTGNIKVLSKNSLVFECGQAKIEMKKDGGIHITGTEITVTAADKAQVKSGQAIFTADGQNNEASMEGVKSLVSGTTETELTSNGQAKINAGATVAVQGALITLN